MKKSIEQIYEEVALENKITVEQLKADMQAAIDYAYINPNDYAQKFAKDGKVPTPDEFIVKIAQRVRIQERVKTMI